MPYEVVDDLAVGRFELRDGDERIGIADYVRHDAVIDVSHVEIDDRYAGRGLGSMLARGVLDAARAAGDRVVPSCPFLRDYVRRHPEYADLVPDGR